MVKNKLLLWMEERIEKDRKQEMETVHKEQDHRKHEKDG